MPETIVPKVYQLSLNERDIQILDTHVSLALGILVYTLDNPRLMAQLIYDFDAGPIVRELVAIWRTFESAPTDFLPVADVISKLSDQARRDTGRMP